MISPVRRNWGNYNAFLKDIGEKTLNERTKEKYINQVKKFVDDNGRKPLSAEFSKNMLTIVRIFGYWNNLLLEAGIKEIRIVNRSNMTDDELLEYYINLCNKENRLITSKELDKNPVLLDAINYAKTNNKNFHLIGLVSDGGVHSHLDHLKGICTIIHNNGIKNLFIHAFTDGRDTDPKGGADYLKDLQSHLRATTGNIASIVGRYFAMDRDKRWERVKLAYDLLVHGTGEAATDACGAGPARRQAGCTACHQHRRRSASVRSRALAGHACAALRPAGALHAQHPGTDRRPEKWPTRLSGPGCLRGGSPAVL